MNISLTGRHVELTEPIKQHMQSSINTLNKYNLDIISVSAVASTEERKGKRGVSIEFTINLAGRNTIVIKQRDDDLYAAIDIAIDRAQKALRRLNERSNDHSNDSLNEAKNEAISSINLSEKSEALEDDIVPVDMTLHKPREIADVLEDLRESANKQFEVFNDLEGKTRVLYKRSDGKFGLF
jgi:putative sigma-54 modulation protein